MGGPVAFVNTRPRVQRKLHTFVLAAIPQNCLSLVIAPASNQIQGQQKCCVISTTFLNSRSQI